MSNAADLKSAQRAPFSTPAKDVEVWSELPGSSALKKATFLTIINETQPYINLPYPTARSLHGGICLMTKDTRCDAKINQDAFFKWAWNITVEGILKKEPYLTPNERQYWHDLNKRRTFISLPAQKATSKRPNTTSGELDPAAKRIKTTNDSQIHPAKSARQCAKTGLQSLASQMSTSLTKLLDAKEKHAKDLKSHRAQLDEHKKHTSELQHEIKKLQSSVGNNQNKDPQDIPGMQAHLETLQNQDAKKSDLILFAIAYFAILRRDANTFDECWKIGIDRRPATAFKTVLSLYKDAGGFMRMRNEFHNYTWPKMMSSWSKHGEELQKLESVVRELVWGKLI
ncbi:hypothetical protein EK21DRAFT_118204 [Setomelanomma holmii]|uniref:Uncharacterized protein n=1 Tax=Setomelanomma holmii TaxID=210430 RepID=A0A9P4GZJ0_9PLEO|nr:hypothetical protein EK21DRAFT_118204 [Setomelanomma holmii]